MKRFILLFFIFCSLLLSGQDIKKTNIGSARKVEVNGGVVTIKNADTVIIKIYTSANLKTKLYLISNKTEIDPTGNYITLLKFNNPTEFEYYDVNIQLRFDKPVEGVQFSSGLGVGTKYEENPNKNEYRLKMLRCDCDEGIEAKITSKERVVVSIYGIAGESYWI